MHLKKKFPKKHVVRHHYPRKPNRFLKTRSMVSVRRSFYTHQISHGIYIRYKFNMPDYFNGYSKLMRFLHKIPKHASCLKVFMKNTRNTPPKFVSKAAGSYRGNSTHIDAFITKEERQKQWAQRHMREQREMYKLEKIAQEN